MTRFVPTAVLVALASATAAGCGGGSGENRAGAPVPSASHVLTIQATDPGDPETVYLAKRIERRSNGSLKVRVGERYDSRLAVNEVRLARDVRAGRASFALLPGRAWSAAGVPGFAALQAPFVITTYPAARAAVAGGAGRALAADLRQAGVEPLALVATQLRRVLSKRRLTTPRAFRGARLRIVDNVTTARDLRALGAIPAQGMSSADVAPALKTGRLDGAESAPRPILENGYGAVAKHLTGYALFDKVVTFVAAPSAIRQLSPGQRDAVRRAGDDVERFAAKEASLEAADVRHLCRQGVRVDTPTPGQLRALSAASDAVEIELRRDPETAQILRLLHATPGAGPQVIAPSVSCSAPPSAPKQATAATIPSGTYSVTLTPQDFHHFGIYDETARHARVTTTVIRPDGRFVYTISPEYGPRSDRCPCPGEYRVKGDHLTLDYDRPDWPDDNVDWSYDRGRLSFSNIETADPADKVYYVHPWRKVR